jgi:hypothetical protein
MAQKRSFMEAMMEAGAVDLGPVGGTKDLKDKVKILEGNLADAEGLIKKLRLMIARKDAKIYTLETEVELLRRAMPADEDEEYYALSPMKSAQSSVDAVDEPGWPVICIDEESDAGDAM